MLLLLLDCASPQSPPPDAASPSGSCGTCHAAQARAFEQTRHAQAATGVVFRALRDRADVQTRRFCDNCHQPSVGSSTGLSCDTCHRAAGNSGTSNARLIWDLSGPIRGPISAPVATRAHNSVMHEFGTTSDFCGTCHEVEGSHAFHETPLTEWRASRAAAQGDSCVSCHMSARPGMPVGVASMGPAATDPLAPSPSRAGHADRRS